MMGRRGSRLWRASALGTALYAVVLVTTPFEHHDFVCHIKTPFHCLSCASNPVGSGPHTPTIFDGSHLTEAGRPIARASLSHGFLLPTGSPGRSPPVL